jgi:6-pyruvoyltetrahydropterin/6-carboxytetrahydropterin synthase
VVAAVTSTGGERHPVYYLTVKTEFAAAHQLRGYRGKCENLHGHNWKVEVVVKGRELDPVGMLYDFTELKARLRVLVDEQLDHRNLNELEAFAVANPSAENIARYLFERLGAELPAGVSVDRVTVDETDRCGATYAED